MDAVLLNAVCSNSYDFDELPIDFDVPLETINALENEDKRNIVEITKRSRVK